MRNKGFFWFLTILLTAVCLYQLSFTWISSGEETKAEKKADAKVEGLKAEADKNGGVIYLPNNSDTPLDFSAPEWKELAKAAYVNQYLKEISDKKVTIFGSAFKDVKERSLAFGLDLVGGMSVTLEVSIPEMVKNYVRNPRDLNFIKAYDDAKKSYDANGGDFITLFAASNKKMNSGMDLVRHFNTAEISELGKSSTDEEVIAFLNERATASMAGVEQIMERRINQFGVAQPNIQKDPTSNRLYIELPGVQDEATVAKKLVSTANLQFFETYEPNAIAGIWQQAEILSKQVVNVELDSAAMAEKAALSIEEQLKADNGIVGLTELTLQRGYRSIGLFEEVNKSAVDQILRREDISALFPADLKFMWSASPSEFGEEGKSKKMAYELYAIRVPEDGKAKVGGKDIQSAGTDYSTEGSQHAVTVKMTNEGAGKWAEMTRSNLEKSIAITMDNVVYSAPNVKSEIPNGNTEITGDFSAAQAKDLAGLLNGGALPAPCVIKEKTKVGPTIGSENSSSGIISLGVAILLIFVYMLFYYGKAGIIADIALISNIIFIFGTLASFGAVLTLAGLAGIVLTIGMAVDANVLIFERIREELATGKDVRTAVEQGFGKALSSIIDANLTTLLTAIILKIFGSGAIESFATTLIIGLFTSVFAALVISRLIMLYFLDKKKTISFDTTMTRNAFKNFNFNFVDKRKMYYVISGVLIAASIFAIATKGLNASVEFSGGRTFGVKFDKSAKMELEYIKKNLNAVLVEDEKVASTEVKTKGHNYFVEITTNYMRSNESSESMITVKKKLEEGLVACKDKLGNYQIQESRSVSPTVSEELIKSSSIAVLLSILMMFAFILLRFGKWQYSFGAIAALSHDVIIVLGAFAMFHGVLPFNMDVDQSFIAAILTVIGYSVNDTVIVFDRIRENLNFRKESSVNQEINGALNSTLSRTINTSFTTFFVLIVVFVFGPAVIKGFIFALMIGVGVGTYSSMCIATPLLIDLSKKLKGKE
jgi:SecD/SecF fusion protein